MCTYADVRESAHLARNAILDTLTIDNRMTSTGCASIFRHRPGQRAPANENRGPFVGTAVDSSDIDLYVLAVPNPAVATD